MRRRAFFRSAFAAGAALTLPRSRAAALPFRPPAQLPADVDAVTGDGRPVRLTGKSIDDLRSALRGRVLLAADDGYDDARRILNPSFDKRPALIAQVTGTADIRTAVDFARDNGGLLLAVKCGGHSMSGQSTCDRGMMIDLSSFRDVRVDPVARRAWVTGGSLLGQLDHESMAYDLVTPMGTVSHTGVGGLVTGGGFGRVARRFGLSIDNLRSVHVVTADGQFRRASADENADLFWGVRGGGGNFGIVTSFEFELHPMQRQIVGGRIAFPLSKARDALLTFGEYGPQAPDELTLGMSIDHPPGGADGVVTFEVCWTGAHGDAERVIAPLRRLGTPLEDGIRTVDYVQMQRSGDVSDPRAMALYLKSGFIPRLDARLADAILERVQADPRRVTSIFFQQSGGAIARVPAGATAFTQRDTFANMLCSVIWPHGQDPEPHVSWIKEAWTGLEPFTEGFYVNDPDQEMTVSDIARTYQENHRRLVEVKNRYDPANLFRLNANIRPTV